jgi:hypothetical protein
MDPNEVAQRRQETPGEELDALTLREVAGAG